MFACACSLIFAALAGTAHAGRPTRAERAARPRPLVAAAWTNTRDVRESLQDVLDEALGNGHKANDVRIGELEEQFRPTFVALPKNSRGLLGHATVRYALHRHFVHFHGMYVKGLEPAGDTWDSTSPVDIMEDKVPSYVQHLFEARLHDGFSLKELALLAATLEHFMHLESMNRLRVAYRLTGNRAGYIENITVAQMDTILDAYMSLLLSGTQEMAGTEAAMEAFLKDMPEAFPGWADTQAFLREVQDEVLIQEHLTHPGAMVSFAIVGKIVEIAANRFGKHQDGGCRELGHLLGAKDEHRNGRVRLTEFYTAGWQFRESKAYLEQFGAIEEVQGAAGADPETYVIIPNYLNSMPNCISSTSLYSICCLDPCENILRQLESSIGGPTATTQQLMDLVAKTPSETVQAPRNLADSLVQRLTEIANGNDGHVPLHGRLFSQWLHHAYPRECPYPAKAGTTRPTTADAWLESQNLASSVSEEELEAMLKDAASKVRDLADAGTDEDTPDMPWDAEEELVYSGSGVTFLDEVRILLRALALVGALCGLALSLAISAGSFMNGAASMSKTESKAYV